MRTSTLHYITLYESFTIESIVGDFRCEKTFKFGNGFNPPRHTRKDSSPVEEGKFLYTDLQ